MMRVAYAGFVVAAAGASGWALYLTGWALPTKIFGWTVLPLASIPMLHMALFEPPRDRPRDGFRPVVVDTRDVPVDRPAA